MPDPTHIPEHDLRQVVLEQQTQLPLDAIETHVSSCEACQSRLLDLAAETSWRNQFSSSLIGLPSLADPLQTTDVVLGSDVPSGDEFDLRTVRQMLAEVLEPPTHPELLGQMGRYDVESILGCGGMGAVLRGFDRDLHRPVAIKVILPRLAQNGTAKQRFAREARAAAAVLHPNVIGIHGIEDTKGIPWFVMPLIAGPSLQTLVETQGPLPEREVVRIGLQIASGLAAAHCQGLVHRDIKPANILVDNQINRVIITDFGLARRDSEESMTQTGWLAGTLNYMSPEQSRGEDVDARSDLFSLGSLLFYLATGVVPFRAESAPGVLHQIGHESPPKVQSLNPEISTALSDVIDRLLEKSPESRFPSAAALESFLNDYLAHLQQPVHVPAPRIPGRRPTWQLRPSVQSIAALVAMVALTGAAVLWGNRFFEPQSGGPQESFHPESGKVTARYALEDAAEFQRQFVELDQQIQQFAAFFDAPQQAVEDRRLLQQLERFSQELNQIDQSLDAAPGSASASFVR